MPHSKENITSYDDADGYRFCFNHIVHGLDRTEPYARNQRLLGMASIVCGCEFKTAMGYLQEVASLLLTCLPNREVAALSWYGAVPYTTEGCKCSMLEPMVQPRANPATPVHMHLPSSTAAIYIYCVHLASPSATSSTIPNLQQRCRRHNHLSYVCRTSEQGTTRLMKLRISSKCSSSCRYRGCAWCSKRTQQKRNNKDAKWRSLSRWVDYLSPAPAPAPASSLLPGSRFAAHLRQSLLT